MLPSPSSVDVDRKGHGGRCCGKAIVRNAQAPGTRHGSNQSGFGVDLADPAMPLISNIQVAVGIGGKTRGKFQGRQTPQRHHHRRRWYRPR